MTQLSRCEMLPLNRLRAQPLRSARLSRAEPAALQADGRRLRARLRNGSVSGRNRTTPPAIWPSTRRSTPNSALSATTSRWSSPDLIIAARWYSTPAAKSVDRTVGYLKPASPIGDDALIGNLKPAAPRGKASMLGLPDATRACLFDLDGVLTQTAKVHATAWKQMFDAFLAARAARTGEAFVPFDVVADYDEYVDGMPRYDGVRSFLASRGIELPEGTSDDPPRAETIAGLGNRKNELVLSLIHRQGVETYEGSIRYVLAVRAAGLRRAVVSSS